MREFVLGGVSGFQLAVFEDLESARKDWPERDRFMDSSPADPSSEVGKASHRATARILWVLLATWRIRPSTSRVLGRREGGALGAGLRQKREVECGVR